MKRYWNESGWLRNPLNVRILNEIDLIQIDLNKNDLNQNGSEV